MDDEGELIDQLDRWLDSDPDPGSGDDSDEDDSENDPEWDFEEGETRVKDATYVFCPAPHRKQILHLFTKHFCQHPSFPERNEGSCSIAENRERAVMEMYQFCRQRGLREVWGVLLELMVFATQMETLGMLNTFLDGEQRWEQKTSGSNSPSPHASSSPRPSSMDSYSQSHSLVHFSCGSSRRHSSFWAAQNHSRRSEVFQICVEKNLPKWKLVKIIMLQWTCNYGQQKFHSQHLYITNTSF